MLLFDALPPDILFQIVALLSLGDIVSLSTGMSQLVNKFLSHLSQERSFWLTCLRMTQLYQPLPCLNLENFSILPTEDLERLAFHSIRLARDWGPPFPQVVGPIKSFRAGAQ
ncbi:hypothetical protein DFH07DRAFT_1064984 [Mycena maculata]|uniref:F-box domain-containing protein n=1 Tax=Mycena maculata TaxID=230809 RepID=A0AAD7MWR0_9AGAR|nr:hypothetical protein DFH07DRAFT_1064984 [Mycena maculata]